MTRFSLLQRYLVGLGGTLCGAAATEATGSMWPLALGASFSLICTVDVVRKLCAAAARRP